MSFKYISWFVKALSYFVLLRSLGNLLQDLAIKYILAQLTMDDVSPEIKHVLLSI